MTDHPSDPPRQIKWRRFNAFTCRQADELNISSSEVLPDPLGWADKQDALLYLSQQANHYLQLRIISRAKENLIWGEPIHETAYSFKPAPTFWQGIKSKIHYWVSEQVQAIHDRTLSAGAYCSCDCNEGW